MSSYAVTSSSPPTSNNIMGVPCSKSMRLVGSGWCKTPSKCSIHLQCTPVFALDRNAPRAILYILLVSFLFAACCASAPFDYIQCLLSLLQLFFTSLSFSRIIYHVFSILVSLLSGLLHSISPIHTIMYRYALFLLFSSLLFLTSIIFFTLWQTHASINNVATQMPPLANCIYYMYCC